MIIHNITDIEDNGYANTGKIIEAAIPSLGAHQRLAFMLDYKHSDLRLFAFTHEANDNSYHGRGCDSAMLFESEFKYWAVNSFK